MQQNSLTLAAEGRPSCILISWRLGVEVRGGVLLHHAFETEKKTVAWRKVSRGIHGEREDGGRASGYVFYPHSVYHLRASPSPAFRLVVKALLKPGLLTVNTEWRLYSRTLVNIPMGSSVYTDTYSIISSFFAPPPFLLIPSPNRILKGWWDRSVPRRLARFHTPRRRGNQIKVEKSPYACFYQGGGRYLGGGAAAVLFVTVVHFLCFVARD